MKIINIYVSYLQIVRAIQISCVLFKHSMHELVAHTKMYRRRRKVHKKVYTTPERIRMTIEELGPTFVKFGQILADRPDMVSDKFRTELKKLQSNARPFSNENALALIEKELNAPIESVFDNFDHTPLAAASIGQVYQAQLLNGEDVIIKIQRPFIENKIKLDIYLMKFMARSFAKNYPELAAINVTGLVDEFGATILKELDYVNEATNIHRFRSIFKDNPNVYIPKVYSEYTTKKLIVMEKISGITPDNISAIINAGLDTHTIAINGAEAMLTMILKHGFFHADPHPGNIFIKQGNVVSFIDFGMVGTLTPRDMDFLADFSIGFARRNSNMIAHALIALCGKKFFENEEDLHFEIHQLMMNYTDVPIENMNFANTMQSCLDIIVKYRLQIPSGIFMLVKALATLEKFAATLDPTFPLVSTIIPYAKDVAKAKYSPQKIASDLYETLTNYGTLIKNFPNDVGEILYKLKEGKIKHDVHLADDKLFVKSIREVSRRIAYVIVLIGMFIGSSIMIVMRPDLRYGYFLMFVISILILLLMIKWIFSRK